MAQSLSTGLSNLFMSFVMLLAGPTVLLYLLKRYVPMVGNELWRLYTQALSWLIRAPFRMVRVLVNEAFGSRRRP